MKWYVIDLQVIEEADSLERAQEIAETWMGYAKDNCADASDEDIARWLRDGNRGLSAGDVEIWQCEDDEESWSDGERVASYSGRAITEAEAEKRGINEW